MQYTFRTDAAHGAIDTNGLVLCKSADGWSLHAPGATDEQIATGDAPYLLSGEGEPSELDYALAAVIADGEWDHIDSTREKRMIEDGSWLTIFADGMAVLQRGRMP